MSNNPVVTLSSKGILTQPNDKADELFGCFMLSNASQSNIYKGNVLSFPAIIQNNANNPSGLVSDTKQALTTLYSGHYDAVLVDVNIADVNDNTDNRYAVTINVAYNQEGQSYSLGKLATITTSKTFKILDLTS